MCPECGHLSTGERSYLSIARSIMRTTFPTAIGLTLTLLAVPVSTLAAQLLGVATLAYAVLWPPVAAVFGACGSRVPLVCRARWGDRLWWCYALIVGSWSINFVLMVAAGYLMWLVSALRS